MHTEARVQRVPDGATRRKREREIEKAKRERERERKEQERERLPRFVAHVRRDGTLEDDRCRRESYSLVLYTYIHVHTRRAAIRADCCPRKRIRRVEGWKIKRLRRAAVRVE